MSDAPNQLVEAALSVATLPTVAIAADRTEANLRWALNSLTTNGQMHTLTLTVIATAPVPGGTAVGTVSREVSTVDEVRTVVVAAESIARSGPPAEDTSPLIQNYPHHDSWDAGPEQTTIDAFADVAVALGSAFGRAREQHHLLFGFAELIVTTTYLGSSAGLRRRTVQPTGRLELNAKSPDFADSAWVGVATRDFHDVDVAALHAQVLQRLGWSATRISLPAGRYETLLPPSAVADLMIYLYWTASARDAEEGRTVFSAGDGATRVGQSLSALPITLRSDPAHPAVQCTPFVLALASDGSTSSVFDNGMPIEATDWISDGRLNELMRDRAWARKGGREPRPPIDNLIMTGEGVATLEEMIASTERGLLLTCLWYIREVDPEQLLLTGLTRDGVYLVENGRVTGAVNNFRFNESPVDLMRRITEVGIAEKTLLLTGLTRDGVYLVENGRVTGAVNNFRFNESPVDLMRRITEVGIAEKTLPREWNDYFTRAVMPAVRVPDFNMSTVSQAS